ncbi:hemolysin activation protein [Planctomycetales bacterium]|nr:hemolysin activation protein [Planctomycetales bacterium]GHT37807.1 hemolysin activation protein [Planctomycetales bacterium]
MFNFPVLLVCLVILISFVSLGARSLKTFSRHQLEEFCRRRNAEETLARILKEYESAGTAAGIVCLIISTVFITVFFYYLIQVKFLSVSGTSDAAGQLSRWVITAALISVSLLFAEFWIAKPVAELWGTGVVYFNWYFWRFLTFLVYPLLLVSSFFSIVFRRLAGAEETADKEEAFEDEIRAMVTEGHREGLLEEDAREMIEGVMELGGFTVSEIMTPRTDMVSISDALSWDEMLAEVITSPHSRIPVYKENRDDIIGVIYSKDLLKELALNTPENRCEWTKLMKEPLFVPETKPVDTLLQEFQNNSQNTANVQDGDNSQRAKGHLAIVLDEYGGVSGIITLEDILEEVVGEILDEHDPAVVSEDIKEIDSENYEIIGKVRIDELNEHLHLHLPDEEDYDTIAGYIFSTLGHIPETGEYVDFEYEGQKIRFTVIEVARRRIEKVKVQLHPEENKPAE